MLLSEKLDELFLNVFSELLELSSFKFSTLSGYELVEKQYDEHMREIEKKISTSGHVKSLSLEKMQLMISASRKGIHKLGGAKQSYVDKIDRSLIIYACSIFDHFINQTINLILIEKPNLLLNEKKTIPYHEFLLYSKEDIIQFTIEKFIHEFSYKSISDRIKHLSEKFELDITFNTESKSNIFFSTELDLIEVSEVFAIRNIIIHNQGKVNKIFLDTIKSTIYKLDDYILLNDDIIEKSISCLLKAASSISRQSIMRYH